MLICVEGFVFSGKTTQMRLLKETRGADLEVILETEFKDGKTVPGNGATLEEAVIFQDWHFAAQIRRYSHAKRTLLDKLVILERGYLSELCYSAAYSHLMGFDLFSYVQRKTRILQDLGLYLLPDAYLVFSVGIDEVSKRRPTRHYCEPGFELPEFWFENSFKTCYENQLDEHIRIVEQGVPTFYLDGGAPIDTVQLDLNTILDQWLSTR